MPIADLNLMEKSKSEKNIEKLKKEIATLEIKLGKLLAYEENCQTSLEEYKKEKAKITKNISDHEDAIQRLKKKLVEEEKLVTEQNMLLLSYTCEIEETENLLKEKQTLLQKEQERVENSEKIILLDKSYILYGKKIPYARKYIMSEYQFKELESKKTKKALEFIEFYTKNSNKFELIVPAEDELYKVPTMPDILMFSKTEDFKSALEFVKVVVHFHATNEKELNILFYDEKITTLINSQFN